MSDQLTDAGGPGELGRFLRACRERTSPRDVGLPDSGRRRTPGLRREEVATLAGVSVDYLVRLEQGRDVHPSAAVLAALADAMRLPDDERRHLYMLGVKSGNGAMCATHATLVSEVPATIRSMLGALDPTPAFVIGPIADVVAWNDAWASVVSGLGMLDTTATDVPPNLARFVFGHPAARAVYPEWRHAADEQAARLRRAAACYSHEPAVAALIEELRQAHEFEVRWAAHPIAEKHRGSKRLTHPDVGDLDLDYEVLDIADESGLQLITWLPGNPATAERLQNLTGAPRLRLVERA